MIPEDHFRVSGLYFLGEMRYLGLRRRATRAAKVLIKKRNIFKMKKHVTLKKKRDFSRLYNKGKSYVAPSVVVYVLRNRVRQTRIGITTSKKVGNAVERNRARRVIREAYRQLFSRVRPGVDLVFVARKKTTQVKSTTVLLALEKLLQDANVLQQP